MCYPIHANGWEMFLCWVHPPNHTHDIRNNQATAKTASSNPGGRLALNLVRHSQNKDKNIVWLRWGPFCSTE